ncbi:hypothetical protein N0V86_009129 [Didymella sp. IMI 355093]|nr:hypothetical protein N0V86_009129 [Didymella sp. IMI 355093]
MSILALYHRIGSGKRGLPLIVQSRAIWATAGLISAFTLAVILVQVFSCVPVNAAWDVQQLSFMCIDGATFMHAQAAINVFTDVVLLLYPLPLLRVLKFNKRQRSALIIIFSIGLIPVIASTMRLCEIVMSGNAIQTGLAWQQADSSWTWAWVPVWSQIEVDIGILTACLPCLSPLLRLFFHSAREPRTLTPSMVTLPEYPGSWASVDSQESGGSKGQQEGASEKGAGQEGKQGARVRWCEKELPAVPEESERASGYYEDASDEEEAREIGIAKEVGIARTSSKRVERSRRMS